MALPTIILRTNRLISGLPSAERDSFLAHCDEVELAFGQVLVEAGDKCRYVYFPTQSFISLVAAADDRARLEVGIVGDEGMLGTSLILGVSVSPLHAVVQGAGPAWRMTAACFRAELERSPTLRSTLNRYLYVLMNQLAQTAICTRYHVVQARFARWLLMTRDRAHSGQFFLTHEFLAYMLGVRRVGITAAAKVLEKRGVIVYGRGKITILDDKALEAAACGCYEQGIDVYRRIMPPQRCIAKVH